MRLAPLSMLVLIAGCASEGADTRHMSGAHGATLELVSSTQSKSTLELKNTGATPLAYDHWMSQGREPVPHCRDAKGAIRICALRVYLTSENDPYIHETYLQPAVSVKFQAAPAENEQVGVHIWRDGRGEYLWLDKGAPNTSLERTRVR
jgi:hypothetical protein